MEVNITPKYEITFLRGRRSGSYIEIIEMVSAEDSEEAVEKAIKKATENKWHVEKVKEIE
jgi:hypothetical protein